MQMKWMMYQHIYFYLKKDEKANDPLRKATLVHNLLEKCLWQYKVQNKSCVSKTNNASSIDIIKEYVYFI